MMMFHNADGYRMLEDIIIESIRALFYGKFSTHISKYLDNKNESL